MQRLDVALPQVGNHTVGVLLGHPEGHVVLGRMAVGDLLDLEEAEHPAAAGVGVDEEHAALGPIAEGHLEAQRPAVEGDGAVQLGDRQVDLVESLVEVDRASGTHGEGSLLLGVQYVLEDLPGQLQVQAAVEMLGQGVDGGFQLEIRPEVAALGRTRVFKPRVSG